MIELPNIVSVYELYNTDGGGRGDHCGTVGWFSSKILAEIAKNGNPFASVKEHRALVHEAGGQKRFYLLAQVKPLDIDGQAAKAKEILKQQALAKLSPEEKAVLGV